MKTYPRCPIHGRNEIVSCQSCQIAETIIPNTSEPHCYLWKEGKDGCGVYAENIELKNKMQTDVQVAWEFFEMLKRNGVSLDYTSDNGQGFKIISYLGNETLEFCFHADGTYWRIMGYDNTGAFSDDIHKEGWK